MILLMSGEGPTDIGSSPFPIGCAGNHFEAGPMAHLIEQLLEPIFGYAPVQYAAQEGCAELLHFIPKGQLKYLEPRDLKALRFRGVKSEQGTKFHFKAAELLGNHALKIEEAHEDKVLAVFFRDADSTNSTPATEWQDKWDSILAGFQSADFERGVPMLPKPKSEAWILCALKNNYASCERLENESGNDASPNSLKRQLDEVLDGDTLDPTQIDTDKLDMPSFNAFKTRLLEVAGSI